MIEIFNFNDERIVEFTKLRDRTLHDNELVVCESEKLYLQFIHNNGEVLKTLSTVEFATKFNLSGNNNFIASKEILESVAGFKLEYSILFLVKKPKDIAFNKMKNKIVILNGVTSPENVGSITRSAAAFKIDSIIVDEKSCSPFLRRCIRVSMGNIFSMNAHHSKNIREDLLILKSLGYKIISTANISSAVSINEFKFPDKVAVIIGSEGHGIDQDILSMSDFVIKINIDSQVAHLNAANAASIVFYQLSLITI